MRLLLICASALTLLLPTGLLADAPFGCTGEACAVTATTSPIPADTIPTDQVQQIRLVDGSVIYTRVLSSTAETVTVETAGGVRMELTRTQIQSMRPARGQVVDGRFWREDPNNSRLFFAPTARPLARGEGYIANYMLFFPFVGYGVTDRFTVAGGTPILPGAIGETFYVAPKLTVISNPGFDLALGALAFFSTGELDEGSAGILFGAGSLGDIERSFTAGAGWGFQLGGTRSRIEDDPVFMLGGEIRTGESTKLITENWLAVSGGGSGILTGGVRFFGERLSADLGIGFALDDGNAECCLPVVNFVYMLGGR